MNSLFHALDWQELRVLLEVVRAGSLSRAGRVLGLSQPTVSRRIQSLEEVVGGPLLARTVSGCVPTSKGAALLPLLEQMERASEGVVRVVSSGHEALSGEVKVATGEVVGRLLMRHSWTLLAGAPGVELQILTGMDEVNLERGDAHIALRARRPETGRLYAKRVSRTSYAAYGSQAFVEMFPAALDERRYELCRWATFVPSLQHLRSARWLLERLSPGASKLLCSTSGLQMEAAMAGAALALLPTFLGDDEPRLRRVDGPFEDLSIDGWMVLHRDTRRLPHVRLIADRIEQLFASLGGMRLYSSQEVVS